MTGPRYLPSLDGQLIPVYGNENCDCEAFALFCHGITANYDEGGFFEPFGEALEARGICPFFMEMRGHGSSQTSPLDFSISATVMDIISCYNELAKVREGKAVVAASFSAGAALMACKDLDALEFFALFNPRITYKNWVEQLGEVYELRSAEFLRKLRAGEVLKGDWIVSPSLFSDLAAIDPWPHVAELKQDIFVTHSRDDDLVSVSESRTLSKFDNAFYHEVDRVGHGFSHDEPEVKKRVRAEVLSAFEAFLDKRS